MNKSEYEEYLQTEHWKNLSKKVKEASGNCCQICNSDENLHVYYRRHRNIYYEEINDLVCLCENCHWLFHNKNLYGLDGELNSSTFVIALQKTMNFFYDYLRIYPFIYWDKLPCYEKYEYECLSFFSVLNTSKSQNKTYINLFVTHFEFELINSLLENIRDFELKEMWVGILFIKPEDIVFPRMNKFATQKKNSKSHYLSI